MEDFFNQFRKNWHSRPAPELDENDWLALQNRLDGRAEKRRPLPFFWWLALPLLLGSMGFNFFFFKELQKIREVVSSLETRRDTVFLTRVVHQTDTVFRTRVLRERVVENVWAAPNYREAWPSKTALQEAVPAQKISGEQIFPAEAGGEKMNVLEKAFAETPPDLPLPKQVVVTSKSQLPTIAQPPITIKKRPKTIHHYLHDLRPTGVSLAATGGVAFPFEPDVRWQSGWSAGLSGGVDFAKKWRFWAEAARFQINFLAERMDEGIGAPPIDPPADNFLFKEADVSQASWQFSLGFDRRFPGQGRRLEPFVGLGYAAVKSLPHEVSYDFVRQTDGVEWTVDKEIPGSGLGFGYGIARAGFGYGFSKNWRLELASVYRFHLEKPAGLGSLQLNLRRGF